MAYFRARTTHAWRQGYAVRQGQHPPGGRFGAARILQYC
jgi:hypothetical protein